MPLGVEALIQDQIVHQDYEPISTQGEQYDLGSNSVMASRWKNTTTSRTVDLLAVHSPFLLVIQFDC